VTGHLAVRSESDVTVELGDDMGDVTVYNHGPGRVTVVRSCVIIPQDMSVNLLRSGANPIPVTPVVGHNRCRYCGRPIYQVPGDDWVTVNTGELACSEHSDNRHEPWFACHRCSVSVEGPAKSGPRWEDRHGSRFCPDGLSHEGVPCSD
jgi:hypothetical protein